MYTSNGRFHVVRKIKGKGNNFYDIYDHGVEFLNYIYLTVHITVVRMRC